MGHPLRSKGARLRRGFEQTDARRRLLPMARMIQFLPASFILSLARIRQLAQLKCVTTEIVHFTMVGR
jgi:hypothetical protein